jgi:hypothetical protein
MCPLAASGPPNVGRTCKPAAPMMRVSIPPVPETFKVIVIVEGSVTATLAEVISWPLAKLMLGVDAGLNSNPLGAVKIRVTPEPAEISDFLPSIIVIGPRVVHAPEPPMPAVSADIVNPPEAAVMEIVAWAVARLPHREAHTRRIVEQV